jgi:NADH-quinone oxidoreductase subunit N
MNSFYWIFNITDLVPDISNLFSAFREVFDMEALEWLSLERYMLLWVCVFWVTLGLMKTVGAQAIDVVYINSTTKYSVLAVLFGALIIAFSRSYHVDNGVYLLNDMLLIDNWVVWAQVGILILAIVFVLLSAAHNFTRNSYYFEIMLFTLTVTFLMTMLVESWNFIIFYLVLEGISLIFYTIATRTFSYGGVESGLKYYSLGALTSVLLLTGILCVFIATGSTDFLVVSLAVKSMSLGLDATLLVVGLILILMAVFFKLSAFPGHVWTPDVYEGTTLEVLWIFAVLAKYTFFVLLLRFLTLFYLTPTMETATSFWIATSCLGSLIIGAAGAFLATNIKRFIAYTAINQMGFLFIGLAALSVDGLKATISYLYIYMLANLLFFCVITLLQSKKYLVGELTLRSLKDIALLKKAPLEMGLLALSLLSLGGLPPLAGFVGKYNLWASLLSQYMQTESIGLSENLLYILIISVILSLLSTFYYLRMIKIALFDNFESGNTSAIEIRQLSEATIATFVIGTLVLITVSWLLMAYDLDLLWTRFVLGLVSPMSVSL